MLNPSLSSDDDLNSAAKPRIEGLVCDVIRKDYLDDFTNIYGLTISITETHPEQANNEVRNALTHLARALIAQNPTEAATQIAKAQDHFERGKRDCLKLAIIKLRERICDSILKIEITRGFIHSSLKARLHEIEKKRKHIYREETRHKPVASLLEDLMDDALDLESQIEDMYGDPHTPLSTIRRWFMKSWRSCRDLFATVFITAIATYLIACSLPEESVIRKHAHEFYAKILIPL